MTGIRSNWPTNMAKSYHPSWEGKRKDHLAEVEEEAIPDFRPSLSADDLVSKGHPDSPQIRVKPRVASILNSAYSVIQEELARLQRRVEAGETLDKEDTAKMYKLTDSLVKLAREEREQEKRDDPAALPLDELIEKAADALELMSKKD